MKDIQQNTHRKQRFLLETLMRDMIEDAIRFIVPDADKLYDLSRGVIFPDEQPCPVLPDGNDIPEILAALAVQVYRKDGRQEILVLNVMV